MEQQELNKIKEAAEEFFGKMTIAVDKIEVIPGSDEAELNIKLQEPQVLIGQGGQTLFEIQRLLRIILNKKLQKSFYLNLDINNYKAQKVEYLKDLAKSSADQVALTREAKELLPMQAYERRIIHAELSQRQDVVTESQGTDQDRHIVIKPK
jgi:spoIIIJ-associated protein